MQEVTEGLSGLQWRSFLHRVFLINIHADTPARNELMKSNAVAAYISCCWCLFQSTRCVHSSALSAAAPPCAMIGQIELAVYLADCIFPELAVLMPCTYASPIMCVLLSVLQTLAQLKHEWCSCPGFRAACILLGIQLQSRRRCYRKLEIMQSRCAGSI